MKQLSHKHCENKDTNTASVGDLVCRTFGNLPRQQYAHSEFRSESPVERKARKEKV